MLSYRLTKWGVTSFGVAFLLISAVVLPRTHSNVFPFFTWDLFSVILDDRNDFSVIITSVDGKALARPVDYLRSEAYRSPEDSKSYGTLQMFGREFLQASGEATRKIFEANYLIGYRSKLEYTLVLRRWKPIEFWKTGNCQYLSIRNFSATKAGV